MSSRSSAQAKSNATGSPCLAYLVSQYPTISHTYLLREIRQLRDLGMTISAISISDPDRPDSDLTDPETEERKRTYYIKRQGVRGAVRPHTMTFVRHPGRYLAGLLLALRGHGWHLGRAARSVLYFVEAVMVGDYLQRRKITRVHTHYSSTVALLMARVFPVDLSMTIHGSAEFDDIHGFLLPEKVAASSQVVAISYYGRSQLMRVASPEDWPKIRVARLGVDLAEYQPNPSPNPGSRIEILCVGSLVPVKGHRLLIQALEQMVREGRNVHLRLVGDGPDRDRLEAHAQRLGLADRVRFEGALPQEDVKRLYGQADIFALASFAEGLPVVLMEAMAMGIPCVATQITGIPELIRDGIDGLLVPPSDAKALSEALTRLTDNPGLREQMGRSGRDRVAQDYDLKRNCKQLRALLLGSDISQPIPPEVAGISEPRPKGFMHQEKGLVQGP